MQVAPGTAQEIPAVAKYIILAVAIIAVILVSAWGKIFGWIGQLFRRK